MIIRGKDMKRVMHDKDLTKSLKEAGETLHNYRKHLEKQIPNRWKITTLFAPAQYQKIAKVGKNRYIGLSSFQMGSAF